MSGGGVTDPSPAAAATAAVDAASESVEGATVSATGASTGAPAPTGGRGPSGSGSGRWSGWLARISGLMASERGRQLQRIGRALGLVGASGLLLWQLRDVSWREIAASLPTHPGFYVLYAALYLQLSLGEVLAYRLCWRFDMGASVPVFLKKRIYNRDILGYSGEVYLFTWARSAVARPAIQVVETIRDQNIVSSLASTTVAVVLVAFYLLHGTPALTTWLEGQLARIGEIGEADAIYAVAIGAAVVGLGALALRFRRYLFTMPLGIAGMIFALHVTRLVLSQALQIWQWALGMPEGSLAAWFTLAAASLAASRIPLLPSREILFVSAGVALAGVMEVSEAAISGMLLVNAVLGKVVSLGLFTGLSLAEARRRGGGGG